MSWDKQAGILHDSYITLVTELDLVLYFKYLYWSLYSIVYTIDVNMIDDNIIWIP